jgi:1,2-diacylglycerol 3-alpha-glucosyltransferase
VQGIETVTMNGFFRDQAGRQMKILMMTNTFTPHVGGVARSVESFTEALRRSGHRVLVSAPSFDGYPADEADVIRFPAWQNFHNSEFSVPMPVPGRLMAALKEFQPDIVHSHHPFLLGDTALRIAALRGIPAVFTHHTMYERYTHYLPMDSPRLRRFAIELAVGYCNLCDAVVAPSSSVAVCLADRGVRVPIRVIPTGIDPGLFVGGDGRAFRRSQGIPDDYFLLGYLGRLSPEKNLGFLAKTAISFLRDHPASALLLCGEGPAIDEVTEPFKAAGLSHRLYAPGLLDGPNLANAYRAMDVFIFASKSETQGMVLAEAMMAGVPVVALDASGVRDIIRDGENGRLLPEEDVIAFTRALDWIKNLSSDERQRIGREMDLTIRDFSMDSTVEALLNLYRELIERGPKPSTVNGPWTALRQRFEEEWKILHNIAHALGGAIRPSVTERQNGKPE